MPRPLNVLFIMVDQMRADAMSCAGHPVVRTPNLDALAAEGVRFRNAFVQQAVCGPSRMCYYTGRYVHNHRSTWNEVPLPQDEQTMGDLFRAGGYRPVQCGKTHFIDDPRHSGKPLRCEPGKAVMWEPLTTLRGMETYVLMDAGDRCRAYRDYLRAQGYPDEVCRFPYLIEGPQGLERYNFKNANKGSVLRAEDSETHWLTDRAIEFMRNPGDRPWMMHLSYMRPHQPTTPSQPYAGMYDPASIPPPLRREGETDIHPINEPFRIERLGPGLDEEEAWRNFRAAYYGLITEIDDNLGRLFTALKETDHWDCTLIIFCADHGEYAGDHWMFEKELWYDQAYRTPFIVRDPRASADPSRGKVCDAFVESVDSLPTMLSACGMDVPPYLDGRDLSPILRTGETPPGWRDAVFADWDYRFYWTGEHLGVPSTRRRAWMVRTEEYKYWHVLDLPPVLFDLKKDPQEFYNVAADPAYASVENECRRRLLEWRMGNQDETYTDLTWQVRPHFGRNPFA